VLLPDAEPVADVTLGLLAAAVPLLALAEPELGTHEGLSETSWLPLRCQCEVQ
jgi:hypothetical protein